MKYLLIFTIIFLVSINAFSQQQHSNVFRDMLTNNPIDLWAGEPGRRYVVLGEVSSGADPSSLSGTQYFDTVVIRAMKDAIQMKADAIINLKCGAHKFLNDKGDYFDKEPWVAMWLKPLYCKGTAVKYK